LKAAARFCILALGVGALVAAASIATVGDRTRVFGIPLTVVTPQLSSNSVVRCRLNGVVSCVATLIAVFRPDQPIACWAAKGPNHEKHEKALCCLFRGFRG
jgi:hypothetical protein